VPTLLRLLLIASATTIALGGNADAQTITTFAGDGQFVCPTPDCGDAGPATAATLNGPFGLAVDAAGNVYIADNGNSVVRRVDATTGIITTYAGTKGVYGDCFAGPCGDGGLATDALLSAPFGLALDPSGNLYIADTLNSRIRRVDAITGVIDTVAGTAFGYDGDGGPAVAAQLAYPQAIAVDAAGNLYIADSSALRVRKVDASTGIISTIAGSIANTAANGGVGGGDGGPAVDAAFNAIASVAVDAGGNLYVLELRATAADPPENQVSLVRRIDAVTGIITTVAGGGAGDGSSGPATGAHLGNSALDIAVDAAGNLYIAGNHGTTATVTNVHRVWMVDPAGTISVVAGTGSEGFSGDGGPATAAEFSDLGGVAVAGNGDVYVSDNGNARVRRVAGALVPPLPDVAIDAATSQAELDGLVNAPASVVMDNAAGRTTLLLPNLMSVACDLRITRNPDLTTFSVPSLQDVGCNVNISDNPMLEDVNLTVGGGVGGNITVSDNTSAQGVTLVAGGGVGGNVTVVDNSGASSVDLTVAGGIGGTVTITDNGASDVKVDTPRVEGDVTIEAGGSLVEARTGDGTTRVTMTDPPVTMTVVLPTGSFTSGVDFSIQSLGAEAPGGGLDAGGDPVTVGPLAAYQFAFDIPALNLDATLTFDIDVTALDAANAAAFLDALASGNATIGVRGDAPGSSFQTFAICLASELPSAGGCVGVERFDAAGTPLAPGDASVPARVRFSGVVGHFSTYALVLVTPPDTTPPVISHVPADIVAEATSAEGAVVDYPMPTAVDEVDGPVNVVCAPGSEFPIGETTVTCSATDLAGNTAEASFLVTVADTTPPALVCPPSQTMNATSSSGAMVTYPPAWVSDAVDSSPLVTYSRASGTLFPIGTTVVVVTATDRSGNTSSDSFSVTIHPRPVSGADLALTNTVSRNPAAVGRPVAYTVTIRNNGPSLATDVSVVDLFLGHLRFVSATSSQGRCHRFGTLVGCKLGNLAAGGTATIKIVVVPRRRGHLTSKAYGWSHVADRHQANNHAAIRTAVR
jgi:uncharacterized repeat protein (TIGR01451 family)